MLVRHDQGRPIVGSGDHRYTWIEDWASIPDARKAPVGWAEHGVAVTLSDAVLVCHPARPLLIEMDARGRLLRSDDLPLTECHGLCQVREGGQEYLWIADIGAKCDYKHGYEEIAAEAGPQVVKLDSDRNVVARRATRGGSHE